MYIQYIHNYLSKSAERKRYNYLCKSGGARSSARSACLSHGGAKTFLFGGPED